MNAVICTDGTAVDDLKFALSKVPDMKGLELKRISSKVPYFYGDENSKYKITRLLDLIKKKYTS
jgi:carbamoyl-phosphate synthase small subunit